jgi:hypothetical protein
MAPLSAMAPTRRYSNRDRKVLTEKIKSLGSTEHNELLRMLVAREVTYTQNNNGVFINMSVLDDDIVGEVDRFVTFCIDNMQELEMYDKRLSDCKKKSSQVQIFQDVVTRADAAAAAAATDVSADIRADIHVNTQNANIHADIHADSQGSIPNVAAGLGGVTATGTDVQQRIVPFHESNGHGSGSGDRAMSWDETIDLLCREKRQAAAAAAAISREQQQTQHESGISPDPTQNTTHNTLHNSTHNTTHTTTHNHTPGHGHHPTHQQHIVTSLNSQSSCQAKKACTKFNIAKKKYSKRKTLDVTKTQELSSNLEKEYELIN